MEDGTYWNKQLTLSGNRSTFIHISPTNGASSHKTFHFVQYDYHKQKAVRHIRSSYCERDNEIQVNTVQFVFITVLQC